MLNRDKTHCPRGHEYTPENTYLAPGRACITCKDIRRYRQTIPRRYGITIEVFEAMLIGQSGRCYICLAPFMDNQSPQVDHDHNCCPEHRRSCGKCVRGLLCGTCNKMLGLARENKEILMAAYQYLNECENRREKDAFQQYKILTNPVTFSSFSDQKVV